MNFEVRYFDGRSSKVNHASLNINPLSWSINYQEGGFFKQVYWRVDEIKSAEVFTTNTWSFKYGQAPFQYLECDDPKLIESIKQLDPSSHLFSQLDHGLHHKLSRSIGLMLASILTLGLVLYFSIIPFLTATFVDNLSKEYVIEFGDFVFESFEDELEIDSVISDHLQDFVDELELDTEFPIKVYLSDEADLNAFAISGGNIVVFRGLLEKMQNEGQLAALLGHEISHVENRHGLHNLARNLAGYFFLSLIAGDINGFSSVLMDNAHTFRQLSYSRSLEKDADIFGMEILKKNDLDQNGMPGLFRIMKNDNPLEIIPYLNSHPELKDRIAYTLELIENEKSSNYILMEKWKDIEKALAATSTDTLSIE